ncbi:response regulator transcription factor [Streptomyces canus]|uniref:response regulator transcription factor n=1 Tax=Streptomyces canus TaxID=58343 RepID=UPI002E28A376|nr:response regulator transcription factor [Streptomyces canus]
MTIRLVLADDQPLVLSGLRMVIGTAPDLEIVGEAGNGAQAVQLSRDLRPDVVVMDIRMPGMDGIEATRVITEESGDVHVIMLTTFDDDENVYGSLRAGASGFLVKDTALDDLLTAIRVVAEGNALIAPHVTRRLIEEFAGRPEPTRSPVHREQLLAGTTEREREVLTLIGRGLSNSEISSTLFIGMATAKTHVARLMSKLGARDRIQLVIIAYEAGLVSVSR